MSCTSETSITWRVILLLAIGTVCCVDATWRNDEGFFRLEVNETCNDNGSIKLKFNPPANNLLYIYALKEDSKFGTKTACGSVVADIWNNPQLLNTQCQISENKLRLRIFQGLPNANILTNSSAMPKYYIYDVDCSDKTSPNVSVSRKTDPNVTPVSFPKTFSIGNHSFTTKTTFNGKSTNSGKLGDDVKIEIDITDKNLFGNKSHITSCEFTDIEEMHSRTILENSCLKSAYKKIEFKSEYTRPSESESAKYTLEFKAFAYELLYPSRLHCQACTDCEPVECSKSDLVKDDSTEQYNSGEDYSEDDETVE